MVQLKSIRMPDDFKSVKRVEIIDQVSSLSKEREGVNLTKLLLPHEIRYQRSAGASPMENYRSSERLVNSVGSVEECWQCIRTMKAS